LDNSSVVSSDEEALIGVKFEEGRNKGDLRLTLKLVLNNVHQ
jgi:hypothetical protein